MIPIGWEHRYDGKGNAGAGTEVGTGRLHPKFTPLELRSIVGRITLHSTITGYDPLTNASTGPWTTYRGAPHGLMLWHPRPTDRLTGLYGRITPIAAG